MTVDPDIGRSLPLLEAVPNFSEGRDRRVIAAIGEALAAAGARVVDVHVDGDHNRSVFTLIGTAGQLAPGLVAGATEAVARLDLRAHEGVHPRVGVCDVLPIVPLAGLSADGGSMADAVQLARTVAAAIGATLQVPTLLYGAAVEGTSAGVSARAAGFAGALRAGGAAALEARLVAGELRVHAGPGSLHPTAGATLVGAREVLVAFNVELASDELEIARGIAAALRESGGGLPGVRALGLPLASQRSVQISTNVERWREVGPGAVLERVAVLAREQGVAIRSCELVGLAPAAAWQDLERAAAAAAIEVRAAKRPTLESHLLE